MQKAPSTRNDPGFSPVEALLAMATLMVFAVAFSVALVDGERSSFARASAVQGLLRAQEGMEAARSVRDASFASLSDGEHGLLFSGGAWSFDGASDVDGIFTRTVTVTSLAADEKKVEVRVSWPDMAPDAPASETRLSTVLTDWRHAPVAPGP